MVTQQKQNRRGTPRPTCVGNKFAQGNKGGRPRKWTDEMIAKEAIALREWIKNPGNYFFTSFLVERGLHPQQIERFAKLSEEFCEAYERAKLVQETRLVEMGITRSGDPSFIKFILQNKAGWKKKNEVSGNSESPLAFLVQRIASSAQDPLEYDKQ